MKLRLLLFILYQKLKRAAVKNAAYQSFLGGMQVKIMIKTADGKLTSTQSESAASYQNSSLPP